MSYDRTNKQTNRDYNFIYIDTHYTTTSNYGIHQLTGLFVEMTVSLGYAKLNLESKSVLVRRKLNKIFDNISLDFALSATNVFDKLSLLLKHLMFPFTKTSDVPFYQNI